MAMPTELLAGWIKRRVAPDIWSWFDAMRPEVARDPAPRVLTAAFGPTARRIGKIELALDPEDLSAAETARPGWRPAGLTVAQAARIVLLLDAAKTGAFAERLKALVATADLGELIAIYKGLPLYPDPPALVALAADGLRTAMRAVFEAIAHHNPFPAEHFPEGTWNHMVLKALFVDSALHPIAGLDARWNEELGRILVDYAHERRAANRPVTAELWRGVGRFADAAAISELARVLSEGDPVSQRAAALALAECPNGAGAEVLTRRRDLARAIAAGDIAWSDVRNQTPLA